MFCTQCGSAITEGHAFCSNCGTKVHQRAEEARNDQWAALSSAPTESAGLQQASAGHTAPAQPKSATTQAAAAPSGPTDIPEDTQRSAAKAGGRARRRRHPVSRVLVPIGVLIIGGVAAIVLSTIGKSSGLPSGVTLSGFDKGLQGELQAGSGGHFGLTGVTSVRCGAPGSWANGERFDCNLYGPQGKKLGFVRGVVEAGKRPRFRMAVYDPSGSRIGTFVNLLDTSPAISSSSSYSWTFRYKAQWTTGFFYSDTRAITSWTVPIAPGYTTAPVTGTTTFSPKIPPVEPTPTTGGSEVGSPGACHSAVAGGTCAGTTVPGPQQNTNLPPTTTPAPTTTPQTTSAPTTTPQTTTTTTAPPTTTPQTTTPVGVTPSTFVTTYTRTARCETVTFDESTPTYAYNYCYG